jgi:hypothetical protein
MSIGDPTTARRLHVYYGDDCPEIKRAPNGFRRIGAGASRVAILEKSTGTVYKIGDTDANVNEAYTSRKLSRKSTRSLGFDFKVPVTRTYLADHLTRVGAQQFVKGRSTYCSSQDDWMSVIPDCDCRFTPCFKTVLDRLTEFTGLYDIHGENVLVDKNATFWIIDMAS